MDLREVGCDAGDWIDLAQGKHLCWAYVRQVGLVNLKVPLKPISQLGHRKPVRKDFNLEHFQKLKIKF